MDLQVSQFELNTREEVKELITKKRIQLRQVQKQTSNENIAGIFGILTIVSILIIIGSISVISTGQSSGFIILILGVFGVIAFASISQRFDKGVLRKQRKPIVDNFKKEVKRLEAVYGNMRTDYEKSRDDQRINMAFGAALNLGTNVASTIASNYINNRKDVGSKK